MKTQRIAQIEHFQALLNELEAKAAAAERARDNRQPGPGKK
jgi:hypothetical protein